MDKKQKQRLFEFALYVGIPLLLWTAFVAPMWKPLFFGVVLAILLSGPYKRLARKLSETWAATLVVLFAALVIVLPVSVAVYYVVTVSNELSVALQTPESVERVFLGELLERARPYLGNLLDASSDRSEFEQLTALLSENLTSVAGFTRTLLGVLYTGVLGIGFGLMVILFALFYLLIYGEKLVEYIEDIAPVRRAFVERATSEFTQMTRVILKTTFIIGVVQGTIGGAGLWYVGTPNAFLWTIVMIVFSMLPVLGAGAILIPTALVYLFLGDGGSFWAIVAVFVVVSVVDNYLKPKIIGGDMAMNGGFVLLSVVAGLLSFGAIGMFAGPIIFALLLALWDTYHIMRPIDAEAEAKDWRFTPRSGTYSNRPLRR